MDDFVLTIIDATGIQDYIFGSNVLRENIGASHLVEEASGRALYRALPRGAHNLVYAARTGETTILDRPLEANAGQLVEVIYRGGGNVVALFRTLDVAKATVGRLTRRLLEDAPGLELAVAHVALKEFPAIGGVDGAYSNVLSKLNRAKQQRLMSTPLLGLGVTLACRSTGFPAVTYDPPSGEEQRPVSAAIAAKSRANQRARRRLRAFLRPVAPDYTYSDDFDEFGRSRGESSYVGRGGAAGLVPEHLRAGAVLRAGAERLPRVVHPGVSGAAHFMKAAGYQRAAVPPRPGAVGAPALRREPPHRQRPRAVAGAPP